MGAQPQTAEAIVACAAETMPLAPFDDVPYSRLAEAVGVSERTVYRHFPTQGHLLTAVARALEDGTFPVPTFLTWEEFLRAAERRFSAFDAAPGHALVVARAEVVSPVGPVHPSFFSEAVATMVTGELPRLGRRDVARLTGGLVHFSSAQFWARCRAGFAMDAAAVTAAFRQSAERLTGRFDAARDTAADTAVDTAVDTAEVALGRGAGAGEGSRTQEAHR